MPKIRFLQTSPKRSKEKMSVVPRFRVQIPLMSNDKKSEFLEIVAKDIIEPNEDTVDNDLKGVLRARLRARADSVIESVGFYLPRGEHAAAIFISVISHSSI